MNAQPIPLMTTREALEAAQYLERHDAGKVPPGNRLDTDSRNAMVSRLERFRLTCGPLPESFVAYVGAYRNDGMGVDRIVGGSYSLTTWTGEALGAVHLGASWRVYGSAYGTRMWQAWARFRGVEYTGRTWGVGMCVNLRLSAQGRRDAKLAGLIQ